jgi:hypothetical protein
MQRRGRAGQHAVARTRPTMSHRKAAYVLPCMRVTSCLNMSHEGLERLHSGLHTDTPSMERDIPIFIRRWRLWEGGSINIDNRYGGYGLNVAAMHGGVKLDW